MILHAENNSGLNWAMRGWMASFGVTLCLMLFVFLGHADYQKAVAADIQNEEEAALAAVAQEFTAWQEAKSDAAPSATNFIDLVQDTSKGLTELVSFDFSVIDRAQVSAKEQRCLAQAIYYEAGFEPVIGQMAVADVVLNRVESSYYPNTVCGVVYQGSHRKTGCQFSFTCDGSLNRGRHEPTYATSQKMAGAILAGVHIPVSNEATHYHADYVSPYWAPKLTKTAEIGAHRFYRYPDKNRLAITDAAQ
ncbi:cell wall hydrolase [Parvularcula sp. IMCC14364]|uniref:cell wall hydrolase n=1 Tax=Parvularcula sp. IMCC14364 TaxID=3067902 RepID=UPI002742206C|nr:cell wall hydrolase [Parvularcula sp. IMCC14364]